MVLEATCGLPLSIFYLISEDGSVTSVFMSLWLQFLWFCDFSFSVKEHVWDSQPLSDKEFKSYDHRGIRSPNVLIRSQTTYPLGYAACWGFSHFCFFCNEWLGWGVKWHTVLAIVSMSIFCLLEIDLLRYSLFCLVKAGQTDVVGSFSLRTPIGILDQQIEFYDRRWIWTVNLPTRNQTPFGLWGLSDFCFVTVNESAEV